MKDILEKIKEFADKAHGEQKRKYTPERYIVHPVRVMEMCALVTDDIPILASALLHDVLEDTPVTKEEIRSFLLPLIGQNQTDRTLKLVVELTDVYTTEAYPQFNRRKRKAKEAFRISKTSADSQTVKYADIIDNCREIVEKDPDFARKFIPECRNLLNSIQAGDSGLYEKAIKVVEDCLRRLGIS